MALSYGWRALVAGVIGTLTLALAGRAIVTGAVALLAPRPWLLALVNVAVTAVAAVTIVVRRTLR